MSDLRPMTDAERQVIIRLSSYAAFYLTSVQVEFSPLPLFSFTYCRGIGMNCALSGK